MTATRIGDAGHKWLPAWLELPDGVAIQATCTGH